MENFNFHIGAIFVIVSVYPWNQLGSIGSPFVATFAKGHYVCCWFNKLCSLKQHCLVVIQVF